MKLEENQSMKNIISLLSLIIFFSTAAYEEKCVGPLDPEAMYKIGVPFKDGKYDLTYDKFDSEGQKYTCFVKVKDADDAIDLVAAKPDKQRFEWLKGYLKTQSLFKKINRKIYISKSL